MDSFDLNIQNYTIKELKGLLSLGEVYNTYDVNIKKESMLKKISNDDKMTIDMKMKMNHFIESVSKILLNLVESSSSSSSNSAVVKKDSNPKVDDKDKKKTFNDLKNTMQKWSNDTIIDDPFSALSVVGKEDKPVLLLLDMEL